MPVCLLRETKMVWVLMEGEVERIMKEMGEGKLIRTYFFKNLFSIRENKIFFNPTLSYWQSAVLTFTLIFVKYTFYAYWLYNLIDLHVIKIAFQITHSTIDSRVLHIHLSIKLSKE